MRLRPAQPPLRIGVLCLSDTFLSCCCFIQPLYYITGTRICQYLFESFFEIFSDIFPKRFAGQIQMKMALSLAVECRLFKLIPGFEPGTSSLPRMCSTNWAILAFCGSFTCDFLTDWSLSLSTGIIISYRTPVCQGLFWLSWYFVVICGFYSKK